MEHSKIIIAGFFLALMGVVYTGPAAAHGGATSMQDDACARNISGRLVHFAVYLPDVAPKETFCDNVPKGGEAVVVMDLVDPELRQLPIEMRVVKDEPGTAENLDAQTVAYVPAKTYPHGVIRTDAALAPGHYFILVNGGGEQPFDYKYGVWVERPSYGGYAGIGFLLVLGGLIFYKLRQSEWMKKRLAG